MIGDTILIIFISIATALLGEGKSMQAERLDNIHQRMNDVGLTWLLVYRTEKYQRLKGEVEKASKRRKSEDFFMFAEILSLPIDLVERQKETVSEAADKVQKRKLGSSNFSPLILSDEHRFVSHFRTARRKIKSEQS